MKKFINVICVVVAFVATALLISSCGKAKDAKGTNLYNYIPNDYMMVAKIDSETLMNNDVIYEHVTKILNEVPDVDTDDLDGVNSIILVAQNEESESAYCLINLFISKEEFLKNEEEDAKVTKIKIGDKEAYESNDDGEISYCYFIDDKNMIISDNKEKLTEVVNQFSVPTVKENLKNNTMLKKDMAGFEKYPVWFAVHKDDVTGRANFSLPTAGSKKYGIYAEVMPPSDEEYDKAKKQFSAQKDMMIGMAGMFLGAPELSAKLKKDLKIDFDDTSKMIKINFSFDPATYEGYTEKLIKLGNKQKQVPGVMTK